MLDKQEQPVEQEFLSDLKRSIEIQDEENRRLPSKTFKPSGMKCMRSMYYQVIGAEPDKENSSYIGVGICNAGSDIHERIQTAISQMKDSGMQCEYIDVGEYVRDRNLTEIQIVSNQGMETKLYHERLNMSFLCDGIVRYKGKYYIVELKTETVNKFWSRKEVAQEHYNQATAYSLALGIDDVIFIYICRDNLDMKSFMFHVTDEMRAKLVAFINECQEYIDMETEPPIPKEASAKFCQYCSYKSICKGV
ncbi:MAG: Dna2/Cas4 domain-containing protein [Bacteroidales bacterium]|nr:Dna2/Cas4 domain-containing protein [Bacteroidales bacterium]